MSKKKTKKKYELTNETMVKGETTLHRIRALKNFADVKKGDLGGWIESEQNLSQKGDCWVYGDACVYGKARVYEDAQVFGNARVYGKARVYGDAFVYGKSQVYGKALVYEDSRVYGNVQVYGNAQVYDNAQVFGNARVYEDAWVYGNAQVYGDSEIYDNAIICGYARIHGDAKVYGDTAIRNSSNICGRARIAESTDHFVIGPIGSRNGYTTFYRSDDGIIVVCGCFKGTIDEFTKEVKKTHGTNRYAKEYLHIIDYVEELFSNREKKD